jgi:hypothetical protein
MTEKNKLFIRKLTFADVTDVVKLDHDKWEAGAVLTEMVKNRLAYCKETSWGCFGQDDKLYGTLFCMKKTKNDILKCNTWDEVCDNGFASSTDLTAKNIFGISLTSNSSIATKLLLAELHAYCIRNKIISVVAGSPVPGFAKWLSKNKEGSLDEYLQLHAQSFIDPQLKFYFSHGFTYIIGGKSHYFPHEKSINNGVFIERVTPKWTRYLPFQWIPQSILRKLVFKIMY